MTRPTLTAELVDDARATLGEGPVWDARVGALVWVDILAGLVHLSEPDGRRRATLEVGGHVGAALPATDGGWLIVTPDGFSFLQDTGEVTGVLDLEAQRPDLRFNDATADPAGRAVAGTMRYDEQPGAGTLYRLECDDDGDDDGYRAVPLLTGQGLCNGIGWSPDGSTMYFVDSLSHQVRAYAYDQGDDRLGPARALATVEAGGGLPDGLCVDAEGGIWVALFGGSAVRRYTPDGHLDAEVRLPVTHPTCPGFGGPDLDRLYITTARCAGDTAAGAGGLWATDPGITGLPAVPWHAGPISAPKGRP